MRERRLISYGLAMTLVGVNGLRLETQESGAGDPLVLVHGSWDDRRVWALIEDDLARAFRVISYDRRGHGASEDSEEPRSRRHDEDDLAGVMEALSLGPARVVGSSFGASIALGLGARRPELFRALCAHEPPLMSLAADDPLVAEVGERVAAVVEQIERGRAEAAARDFIENIAMGPGAWEMMPEEERAAMVGLADPFAAEQRDPAWADIDLDSLSDIRFPVLLTQGEESPPFFSKIIGRLSEVIHGVEVRTLPGAGHVPHLTHPTEYVATISGFLTR